MWRVYVGIGVFLAVASIFVFIRHTIIENHDLKSELRNANITVKALDDVAKKRAAIHEIERNRIDEIEQAPDSDDGPIAPVLRRTLDGMR